MRFSFYSRRGQTLVEALVALSILTVGFVGIVTLLSKSFQLNRTTANDTQATYLASEGIEVVKNLIDHDVYSASGSDNNWAASFPNTGYYNGIEYDTTSTAGLTFSPTEKDTAPLYYDSSAHVFTYNSFATTPTNFVRNIYVVNNGNELDVQSIVTWTDSGLSNTVTLEDHFYDWNP